MDIDPQVIQVEGSKTLWMRPELGRSEATAFLSKKPAGTFVIRNSTQIGCYAITMVALKEGRVWNGLIEQTSVGFGCRGVVNLSTARHTPHTLPLRAQDGYTLNKSTVKFPSLSTLVLENLKEEVAVKQCGLPCPLALPVDDSCDV